MNSQPIISEYQRRAMATEFAVMIPGDIDGSAEDAFAALEIAERLENLLSIYRPDSDISRLNQAAGQQAVALAPETFQLLSLAQHLSQLTDGAFDVTAGPLVEAWGFAKRQGSKPSTDRLRQARELVGYQHLHLDPNQRTAQLARAGMSVNLGAIGKGFALDQMSAELQRRGLRDFLIHGGRSSVLAIGDDVPGHGTGWRVAIEHPTLPGQRLGGVRLQNTSLGTSGSGKQFFHFQGKRYGHVIDPRTGEPAGDLLSLTILTPQAAVADALATGLFVTGEQHATQWVAQQRGDVIATPAEEVTTNEAVLATKSPASDPADDDPQDWAQRLSLITIRGTTRQAEVILSTTGLDPDDWLPAEEPTT